MKHLMTFDAAHKLAYVYATTEPTGKGKVARTVDVMVKRTTLYVDLDETGRVLGVEVLAPSRVTLTEIMEQFSKKFAAPKRKKPKPPASTEHA